MSLSKEIGVSTMSPNKRTLMTLNSQHWEWTQWVFKLRLQRGVSTGLLQTGNYIYTEAVQAGRDGGGYRNRDRTRGTDGAFLHGEVDLVTSCKY